MVVIRAIFRFIVFLIAIAAIVVILGAGYWAFTQQGEQTAASISVGDDSVGHSPQSVEEFFLGLYLPLLLSLMRSSFQRQKKVNNWLFFLAALFQI